MFSVLKKSKQTYLIVTLYLAIFAWWLWIQKTETDTAYLFNWSYGLIGLTSAIYGWRVAMKSWGGTKSAMGRMLIALGIGLFAQWVGLQIWTYYNLVAKVELPYPSLADVGYFGLIPAYTYAAFMLVKVCSAKLSLKTSTGKLLALLLPAIALGLSFFLFLRNIGYELSEPLRLFFDIGYPVGEIIPVTIAFFVLLTINAQLGGKMRSRILLLIFAFFFQFLTEYTFLYRIAMETYVNGGLVDLMYATSYAIMGLALVGFSSLETAKTSASPSATAPVSVLTEGQPNGK